MNNTNSNQSKNVYWAGKSRKQLKRERKRANRANRQAYYKNYNNNNNNNTMDNNYSYNNPNVYDFSNLFQQACSSLLTMPQSYNYSPYEFNAASQNYTVQNNQRASHTKQTNVQNQNAVKPQNKCSLPVKPPQPSKAINKISPTKKQITTKNYIPPKTNPPLKSSTDPTNANSSATTSQKSLDKNMAKSQGTMPEKEVTEQILLQLSNLDKQNLKLIINNSNAKFEPALQAQARKKFRSEIRKKLQNFNLKRAGGGDHTHNNQLSSNEMIDLQRIPIDVLQKIEEVLKSTESQDEILELADESEGDDDAETTSNDVVSDAYMLLVKYGLIPETAKTLDLEKSILANSSDPLANIDETNNNAAINIDEIPSVPSIYDDATFSNHINDDVILIEPRPEIITIGSPEHEVAYCSVNLGCNESKQTPENEIPEELTTTYRVEDETPNLDEPTIEHDENLLGPSILTIIKEYNLRLQKCYEDKKEIDLKIATLQSEKDGLEQTIIEIQKTQIQLLDLFVKKSIGTTDYNRLPIQTASEINADNRKRRCSASSNSSTQGGEKQPRLAVTEISSSKASNDNGVATTTHTISEKQCSIGKANTELHKDNIQDPHVRFHAWEVKDVRITNDYYVVSVGCEIIRYSRNNFKLEKAYKRHRSMVTGIYVVNNEYVFSVSLDMALHKFSLEGFQNPLSTTCLKESLTALEYGWNNLYIGTARGRIHAFSIETNKICLDFHSDLKNSVSNMEIAENTNKKFLIVLISKSLNLYICDAVTGQTIRIIETYNYVNDIAVDSEYVYCGLNSNELLMFNIFNGRPHDTKELDTKSAIKCVKTYKNLVLIGCCDGYIHVYHKSSNVYLDLVRITDKGLINFELYPRKIVFCAADKSLTVNDMPHEISGYTDY